MLVHNRCKSGSKRVFARCTRTRYVRENNARRASCRRRCAGVITSARRARAPWCAADACGSGARALRWLLASGAGMCGVCEAFFGGVRRVGVVAVKRVAVGLALSSRLFGLGLVLVKRQSRMFKG